MQRRYEMQVLPVLLFTLAVGPLLRGAPAFESRAEIDRLLRGAVVSSAGTSLERYAAGGGAETSQFENFVAAARRILAGEESSKQTPDETARQLEQIAARTLESNVDPLDRIAALQARFHARRIMAAIHYNLFRRGLRLAELVAATYAEKEAVVVFRELVTTATAARHPDVARFRADLRVLESSLKDLEEQCCPPDEAILKEPVWRPRGR